MQVKLLGLLQASQPIKKHTVFNKAGFVWDRDLCLNPWSLRIYTTCSISLFTAFYLRVKHIHVYLHLYPSNYHK